MTGIIFAVEGLKEARDGQTYSSRISCHIEQLMFLYPCVTCAAVFSLAHCLLDV